MVRAESTNSCTANVDTNHSTIFALLVELNVIYRIYSNINRKILYGILIKN